MATKFTLTRTWHQNTSKAGKVDVIGLFDFDTAMKYLQLEASPPVDKGMAYLLGELCRV